MSMTERSKARMRFFGVRIAFKGVPWLLTLPLLGSLATVVCAQTVEIKLVNGRSGRPMVHGCVNVGADHLDHMLAIPTNGDGIARLRLTDNDAEINTQNHSSECGDWGVIDPVVKYSDTIGVNAGYVLCMTRTPDYSWLARMSFSTKELLQHGIVTANTCGRANAPPKPGEVIIFVRPLTWWERLKQ